MNSLIDSFIGSELIRAFALTLFHSLWQGAVLAILTAAAIFILRKFRPTIRYTVLYIFFLLMPVLFVTTFFWIYQPERITGKSAKVVVAGEPGAMPKIQYNTPENESNSLADIYQSWVGQLESHARWLVLFWLCGFIFFLARFWGSLFYIRRLKTTGLNPVDTFWMNKLSALSVQIGLKRKVRFAESMLIRIPVTIGFLKPVILLPLGTIGGVPPQQLEAILLHELAHILRKDYLLNVFQSVIEIAFFYHPVTWWLSGKIRQEREHICDDLVISVNHDHINYIKALTTMEEFNAKSPGLAHAITGSRKKLLTRVKRMVAPVKFRKSRGEGIAAVLIIIGLILTLSMNAISVIPSSYDLTGRESGQAVYNLLPFSPADPLQDAIRKENTGNLNQGNTSEPDSVVATSKSGRVIIKVYTDSTDADDQKNVEVIVENIDDQVGKWEQARDNYTKEVIVIRKNAEPMDSISKIIVIREGDSVRIIKTDTLLMFPEGLDSSFTTEGGIGYYRFDAPEIPEFPDMDEMPELNYFYFGDDQKDAAREFERALRDQESDIRDMERKQREFEIQMGDQYLVNPELDKLPKEWKWTQMNPEPPIKESERIIRQELRDNGLTMRGKKYVVELDSKSMYINGDKQPKDVYRKYRKLVEGLEHVNFGNGETFKMIF